MKLKDKVAIVTGGASGIGRAIVERFIHEGAKVIALDIDEKNLQKLAEDYRRKKQGFCITQFCDVTSKKQVNEIIEAMWEKFDSIDILINNAGGGSTGHPVELLNITEEMWDHVLDLNLKSVFFCSQSFIRKHIEANTHGVIVNMASQAGIVPNELMRPHYTSAKAGVVGLTKHMSKSFAPQGFRINAVAPGYCISGERMAKHWASRDKTTVLKNVPFGRASTPEEQAGAVLFLSSDDSTYITGTVIDVTGGGF